MATLADVDHPDHVDGAVAVAAATAAPASAPEDTTWVDAFRMRDNSQHPWIQSGHRVSWHRVVDAAAAAQFRALQWLQNGMQHLLN